jgi:branched-subunit amino acid ABC-type transport system permease component
VPRKQLLVVGAACAALPLLVAWLFELSLERAVVLAPVLVVVAGAAAGLVVLWTRVVYESLRRRRHPWRIVAAALAVLVLLAALSLVVGPLPRE